MANSPLHQLSVAVPEMTAHNLRKQAEAKGYTLHRYLQKTLVAIASQPKRAEPYVHVLPSDANADPLTETLQVEMPLALAMRLHSAARQMRDPSGAPCSPTWLARQIVLHFCYKPTDIMTRIKAEVDPAYEDIVPFLGRVKYRAGQELHLLPIKCTYEGRASIMRTAQMRGVTVAALVRKILDKVLPPTPGTAPSQPSQDATGQPDPTTITPADVVS